MRIVNPQIKKLLDEIGELSTFAGAAAQSAGADIEAPVAVAAVATPLTDELIGAYRADEQQDRGALYRAAVALMKEKVAALEALEVLVEEAPAAAAPAPSSGTLPLPAPPPAPVVEPAPAAPPAPELLPETPPPATEPAAPTDPVPPPAEPTNS